MNDPESSGSPAESNEGQIPLQQPVKKTAKRKRAYSRSLTKGASDKNQSNVSLPAVDPPTLPAASSCSMQTIQDLTDKSTEKSEAAAHEMEQEKKKWNHIHEDAESKLKLVEKERNDLHQKLEDQNKKLRELTSTNEEQAQSTPQLMKDMEARHQVEISVSCFRLHVYRNVSYKCSNVVLSLEILAS